MTKRLDLLLGIERNEKLVLDDQDPFGCWIGPGPKPLAVRFLSVAGGRATKPERRLVRCCRKINYVDTAVEGSNA